MFDSLNDDSFRVSIITLEDVLEALLQEQIYDEMDADGRMCSPEEVEVIAEDAYGLMT